MRNQSNLQQFDRSLGQFVNILQQLRECWLNCLLQKFTVMRVWANREKFGDLLAPVRLTGVMVP
jgi:hypothetical protein